MADTAPIDLRLQRFCEQYHNHKQKYVKFALMFVRDRDDVEDIVNDSFMNLWESRDALADVTNLESYFYTIVKNNCRDWIRSRQTHLKIQQNIHDANYRLLQYDLNALDGFDPHKLLTKEIRTIMEQQLERMPELTRKIFVDSRFNGLTYDNIAQKYRISVRMVTREIQAALSALRISLSDYLTLFIVSILMAQAVI